MVEAPGFRPLYQQVRDMFLGRISDGSWAPGQLLPSEQALAADLGVSQGTVRKALDSLTSENLVERRQGKGTYVAEVTDERSLFQFFRISRPGGERMIPESGEAKVTRRTARAEEIRKLNLAPDAIILDFVRTRFVDGAAAILERVIVPAARFPDLDNAPLPNAVYAYYQREYGINVIAADEELKAIAIRGKDAAALGLAEGAPVLSIERVAFDLDGNPVEWRQSVCDTRHLVYAVTLR